MATNKLNPAATAAVDAVVASHPRTCARDLLVEAHAAANRAQQNLRGDEVDMYVFLTHRKDCGYDCDSGCPVSGKPPRN